MKPNLPAAKVPGFGAALAPIVAVITPLAALVAVVLLGTLLGSF